ncbi:MAG: chromosome segregation protein SMC [bacterium]
MYIKEIEIDNFKSFADKTTIPFLDGFTTISGPNGSGKSNIIDSILFALGLSTSRTLRAEKLFDLISNHNSRNEASVRISFTENSNEINLIVTRKIKKSSNNYISSYYLNDKASTLGEIHEELVKYNISPGCYNVMMQGDVTGIINMTANERRKILDEIAGVADFDRRIDQAKKELETVEQRVSKSGIILNEIDIRLVQLEEERSQALKYQNLKEEKQNFENKLSVVRYFEIKNSIERLHESILDSNKSKKDEQQKLNELNNKLETIKIKLKEISDLVKTKGEDEQIELKKQIEVFKGTIARKKDSIAYNDKQISDNNNHSESAKENINKLKEKIEDLNFRIENKQDEINIIEQNIKKEKQELNKVLSEISGINKTTDEHLEKRNDLRKQFETQKDQENEFLKEKLTLEEKVLRYQRDIKEAEEKIQNSQELKNEYSSKKEILENQILELTKDLKDYEILQKNNLFELDKIKNELNDLNYKINMAYRKITQLEANKKALEDANFGKAIETIMTSGLSGIHAPLAQLGQVNKEYSTALEIAMGGRMRFIVVDNDETASVAIEILKSSQAGRATFLPLNKMTQAPRDFRPPKMNGIIDFAINLINFDDIYRSVFFYALGDTLIVEDLNIARSLIGKYRMVTLDGSLIEKTGAMTGGSTSRSNLRFAQTEDDELKIYKERLKELENKSTDLENTKFDLEKKLDKTRHEYSNIMNDLNRKKIELENLSKNLENTESTIISCQETITKFSPELEISQEKLIILNEKLEKISNNIKFLHEEIISLEKILPKDELAKLNELTDNIEFEIKSSESKLANCQNEIEAMKMKINFNKETISVHEERIQKLAKDNITLSQEKELYKNEISLTEERLKELNEKIKEIGSELVELQQERSLINEEILNFEKKKSISENKIERTQEQIEAYKARRKELEPELYGIRDELVQQGYDIAAMAKMDISVEEVNKNIAKLQRKMQELEPVNMKALVEYDEVQNRKQELETKINTLVSEQKQINDRMNGYEDMKYKSFMDTFSNVNNNFKEIFEHLSDGIGSLILENAEKPFNGGLTIEAQPRGKKPQRMEAMSGGEKSLTALAFVFALQRYMPAPFYAFDEVDMHLDGINAEKLAHMIKNQSANTQFIVVSLRKPMIESANRTIGVTQKNNGITKVTGVKLND